MTDLNNLTWLELIELRSEVNQQIEKVSNRDKFPVYEINIGGNLERYIYRNNAMNRIKGIIKDYDDYNEDDFFSEDYKFETSIVYFDSASLKSCDDYNS